MKNNDSESENRYIYTYVAELLCCTSEATQHCKSTMCMHAKSLQFCQTLCYPMHYSLPGSSVHGINYTAINKLYCMGSIILQLINKGKIIKSRNWPDDTHKKKWFNLTTITKHLRHTLGLYYTRHFGGLKR